MADLRTSFPVLEDSSTQAGLPLHKVLAGDAAAAKNALAALVFKDPSGNLQYARVNSDNEVIVSTQSDEVACLNARGSVGGSASFVAVATITLGLDLKYNKIGWIVACFRDAEFEIIWNDNGVETILASILVGSGDINDSGELDCLEFMSGLIGTQELKIKAKNFNALSDFRATLSVLETQGV